MTGTEYQYKNRFNGCVRPVRVVHYIYKGLHTYKRYIRISKTRSAFLPSRVQLVQVKMWTQMKTARPYTGSYHHTYHDNYPEALEYAMKESNKALQHDRF